MVRTAVAGATCRLWRALHAGCGGPYTRTLVGATRRRGSRYVQAVARAKAECVANRREMRGTLRTLRYTSKKHLWHKK